MKRGYASVPEGQLHYYEHGRGAPLLMLHETPRSAFSYAPLMSLMGKRFRCLAPDTLGFGMSDPLPSGATMEDLARSMVHLLDSQGIAKAHVLGFHTGNKIGAALAAQHPDRVAGLVLIGMTHSLVVNRKARNAAILAVVSKYMNSYAQASDGSHLLRNWGSDFNGLVNAWWNPAVMTGKRITEAQLAGQQARAIEMIQCRNSIRDIYAMNFGFDFGATLRRVKHPTLVIECCVPEEAHLSEQGPLMLKLLKRGQLLTLQHASFDATESHARDIAGACSKFLSDTE
jgi:pimeloyl-ACP methyl ester carboxylesterase